ncbi:MAG: PIN domain-containing protein [Hyphomicrobiaceae bacterium]|nr:MAG: PIN domain-containing protein [Hyphomicrobiaceae bacterium]
MERALAQDRPPQEASREVTVFIDSSVWFATANIRDGHNARAKTILTQNSRRLTTDHVLVETWLLLNSRVHRRAAEGFWEGVRRGACAVEKVASADLEAAWAIGLAFPDQDFSIVDRTSFAVMERLGVARVASFDDDFAIYRYGLDRSRAFEVLR